MNDLEYISHQDFYMKIFRAKEERLAQLLKATDGKGVVELFEYPYNNSFGIGFKFVDETLIFVYNMDGSFKRLEAVSK